ncbi:MAG: AAA family ATPase [Acidobacteria bacterium]|nr:AAA family ATPase [Acidobacteriota bacterium]MCB9398087.1 AAA family ATPase [Acidobacteriota bacterium]
MTHRDSVETDSLDSFIQAGRPLLWVQTGEEDRLQERLAHWSSVWKTPLWTWDCDHGLGCVGQAIADSQSLGSALRYLQENAEIRLVWLKDAVLFSSPEVARQLRDLYYAWRHTGKVLVLSGQGNQGIAGLQHEMVAWRMPRPDEKSLRDWIHNWAAAQGDWVKQLNLDLMVGTLKGLTRMEADHALHRLAHEAQSGPVNLRILQEEKRRLIENMGTLQYIAEVPKLDHLGGLENLKDWLLKRRELLMTQDPHLKDIAPKGIMLMGVSGCGKSLCIKAISSAWNLPLYRLEMSKIFSGAQGSPEHVFVESCKAMEELAPAVLWIDEIEMGLAATGSTAVDPVLSRIFAFFLTWMQEKPMGLFVAATANRIDLLPAEMIRKGRFDQVFFVDLPSLKEREDIFRIHLSMRGFDPSRFDVEIFADSAQGWNGAEIEQCVVAAVTQARMENRDLELKDLYLARKQIVPISTTMEEQVRHIRNWAYERAVRASAGQD